MRRASACRLFACATLCGLGGCVAPRARDPGVFARDRVPIQWGVDGSERGEFSMEGDWARVRALFDAAGTPDAERESIRDAIALFEQAAGAQTPTRHDLARGGNAMGDRGRMDCVDESTNTTNYLWMLWHEGMLRHHAVEAPRWRARFLTIGQHRTAVIRECESGELWAVDSWVRDNGGAPDVQPLEAWRRHERAPER